jgi:hypothetical protein
MNAMRRVFATLLVVVFSGSLIAPALVADSESQLPACCRRLGEHHCATVETDRQAGSGPAIRASLKKCPSFPDTSMVRPYGGALSLADGPNTSALVSRGLSLRIQATSLYRATHSRSRQKRGPPSKSSKNPEA